MKTNKEIIKELNAIIINQGRQDAIGRWIGEFYLKDIEKLLSDQRKEMEMMCYKGINEWVDKVVVKHKHIKLDKKHWEDDYELMASIQSYVRKEFNKKALK